MKIYTCTEFTGHYPVGTAAIVRASSPLKAAAKLNLALRLQGLPGDAELHDMVAFPREAKIRILRDGNY